MAAFVDWSRVHLSSTAIARQLLRSAFYAFFLHEQFHHNVECPGLRLLVSTDSDGTASLGGRAGLLVMTGTSQNG